MLDFDTCDRIAKQVAREALIGTGLEVLTMISGRVLGVSSVSDAYDIRIGRHESWMRIISLQTISCFECANEGTFAAAVNAMCALARREIATRLRDAALKMESP